MQRFAVIGLGPIGAVLSAALSAAGAELIGVERNPARRDGLTRDGLVVLGLPTPKVRFVDAVPDVAAMAALAPEVVVVATKASGQRALLAALDAQHVPGRRYVFAQNGLGNIQEASGPLGPENVARLVLNFGAHFVRLGLFQCGDLLAANHIGALDERAAGWATEFAALLSAGGLDTRYAADIRCRNWEKVILNATVNGICALTGQTIAELTHCGATRAYLGRFVEEVVAVARAEGCEFPDDIVPETLRKIHKAGDHKPSMAVDLDAGRPTEIAYLNGRISALGQRFGVPTPHNDTIALLVRGVEMHRGLCAGCQDSCDPTNAAACHRCPNVFD